MGCCFEQGEDPTDAKRSQYFEWEREECEIESHVATE